MVATAQTNVQMTPYLALVVEQLRNGTFAIDSQEHIEKLIKEAEKTGMLEEIQVKGFHKKVLALKTEDGYLNIEDTKKNRFLMYDSNTIRYTELKKDTYGYAISKDLFELKDEDFPLASVGNFVDFVSGAKQKADQAAEGTWEGAKKGLSEWTGFAVKIAKYAAIAAAVVAVGVIATGGAGAVMGAVGTLASSSWAAGTFFSSIGGGISTAFGTTLQAVCAFGLGAAGVGALGGLTNKIREQIGWERLPSILAGKNINDPETQRLTAQQQRQKAFQDSARNKKTGAEIEFEYPDIKPQEVEQPKIQKKPSKEINEEYGVSIKGGGAVPDALREFIEKTSDGHYDVIGDVAEFVSLTTDDKKRADDKNIKAFDELVYPSLSEKDREKKADDAVAAINTAVPDLDKLKGGLLKGDARFAALAALGKELEKQLPACVVGKEGLEVKQPLLGGKVGNKVAWCLGEDANKLVMQAAAAYTMQKQLEAGKNSFEIASKYYVHAKTNPDVSEIKASFSEELLTVASLKNPEIRNQIVTTFQVMQEAGLIAANGNTA